MHVCHFITTLERGGAQSLVRDIIANDNSETQHSVCHFGQNTALETELKQAGATVVTVGNPSYIRIPLIMSNLSKYLQRRNVDILHTHLIHSTVIGRVAGYLSGVDGIISSIHNVQQNFSIFERQSERLTRPLDSATVAVSAAVHESFGSNEEWETIPNGIPTETFGRKVKEADTSVVPDDARRGNPTFLNVARYVPAKNQALLVRAMERVVRERPGATLLLVGRGPEESQLRSLVSELDLNRHVFITGEVPEIHPYFAVADWFVLPSTHEGLPITVLEAMAAGLPVIASGIPGVRGVVKEGETGVLFQKVTIESLAEAMLLRDLEWDEMSSNAEVAARDKFDISTTVRQYSNLYRDIDTQ